jgi:hypothetical protein
MTYSVLRSLNRAASTEAAHAVCSQFLQIVASSALPTNLERGPFSRPISSPCVFRLEPTALRSIGRCVRSPVSGSSDRPPMIDFG